MSLSSHGGSGNGIVPCPLSLHHRVTQHPIPAGMCGDRGKASQEQHPGDVWGEQRLQQPRHPAH